METHGAGLVCLSAGSQVAAGSTQCGVGGQDRLGSGEPGGRGARELSGTGGLRAAGGGARLVGSLPPGRQDQSALPATGGPHWSPHQTWQHGQKGTFAQESQRCRLSPERCGRSSCRSPLGGQGQMWGGALPSEDHPGPGACAAGPRTPRDTVCPQLDLSAQGSLQGNLGCVGTSRDHPSRVRAWRDFGGSWRKAWSPQGRIPHPPHHGRRELGTGSGKSSGAPIWPLQPRSR